MIQSSGPAAFGQRAALPVHIAGGQVREHQIAFGQVLAGQAVLDPLLALAQPVHGGVYVVHMTESERDAQLRRKPPVRTM